MYFLSNKQYLKLAFKNSFNGIKGIYNYSVIALYIVTFFPSVDSSANFPFPASFTYSLLSALKRVTSYFNSA